VSISALAYRTPLARLLDDLPAIRLTISGCTAPESAS
jgi:hypothetical protein